MSSAFLSLDDDLLTSAFDPHDLDSTLTAVCKAAVNLVGVDHSGLVFFDRDRQWGSVVAEYPHRSASAIGKRVRLAGVSLEENLTRNGQPMVVNNVKNESSLGQVYDILLGLGIKSIVVVPITVDGEIVGSFSFDSIEKPRSFEEADIQKCASLADFASVVIKNVYLLKNLEALRQAMLAIASEQEREPLLQTVIVQAAGLLGAHGGGIYEYDYRRKALEVAAAHNAPGGIVGRVLSVGEGMAGRLIVSADDHMSIPDYKNWEYRADIYNEEDTFGSVLSVPLIWREQRSGVLWVHAETGRRFAKFEVDLLKRLAATAAIAFEQSRLRESERYKVDRLRRLVDETNSMVRQLGSGDRDSRLELIAKCAHEIINAESCGVTLVERTGWLTLVANHGHKPESVKIGDKFEIRTGSHTGLTGHIATKGEVFRACGEELTDHPAVKHTPDASALCHSLLAIPLKNDAGDLRGLLRISNKIAKDGRPSPWTCFTVDDQMIAELFAQAAMVEIETADLVDGIKRGETRYTTLLKACKVVVQEKSLEDGLRALAQTVMQLLDRSFCRVLLIDEGEESLKVVAAARAQRKECDFRWSPRIGGSTPIRNWIGLDQTLKSDRASVLEHDGQEGNLDQFSKWIELLAENNEQLNIQSLLMIPLKVGKQVLGLLTVGELRNRTRAAFTERDIKQGEAICALVAALIERLERHKRFLNDLFKIERAITTSNSLEETLNLIAAQVFEVAHAYDRHVNVVDINLRDENKIRVVAVYPECRFPMIRSIVGEDFDLTIGKNGRIGIVGKVLQTGDPIIEGDVLSNPHYIKFHEDTRSQLVVPINDGGGFTIGAISVENTEVAAFDLNDQVIVQGLASQAASAIAQDSQSRENKKTRTVALVGAAGSIWRHSFTDDVSLILNAINSASSKIADEENLELSLAEIKRKLIQIKNFPFTGPLSSDPGVKDELLNVVVEASLQRFETNLRMRGPSLNPRSNLATTTGVRIRINKVWFQYALDIFLENAREAVVNARSKLIEVTTQTVGHSQCRILIKNTGSKIDDKIWEKLGSEQIAKPGAPERGVGILIADLILAVYGGKPEKICNEEDNVIMGIILPTLRGSL